ncbi:MAG TPA: DUF1573 domain-containing protein [Pirellulales bacterium]|nr:DUF1573 domain-containing protein [Pirellulales bacterium]
MLRSLLALLIVLLAVAPARAQDWAVKMFNTMSHDFGTVAKGSKAQFRFEVKNIYEEDARIVSVRSSCSCTSLQVPKQLLKTFETGEIIADFNTRDFQGQRSATIFVRLDCVSQAEVQLRVSGFIRSDVVLQPGALDWGTVDFGTPVEKVLQVAHVGSMDWRILDVKTADPHFEVELSQPMRTPGRISYELLVRLTKDAPIGYLKDQLILVTNDAQARELPVDMEGRIVTDITISPAKLFIGAVQPGQKVTKNLVVRGKKPFRIVDVQCPNKNFTIEHSDEPKAMHLVPVVFTAGDQPGRVAQKISIRTDLGENTVQAFTAYAEVVKPEPAAAEATPESKDAPAEKP